MEWVWEGQVYHHEQGCDNSVLRRGGPSLSPLVSSAYFKLRGRRARCTEAHAGKDRTNRTLGHTHHQLL